LKTYQDLIALGDNDNARRDFLRDAVNEHKASDLYKIAVDAEAYDRQENPTIVNYKKLITNMLGQKVEDIWSANYRLASNHFNRFITQENQYLLGNGLNESNEALDDIALSAVIVGIGNSYGSIVP
jgi:hypothetical protein